MDYFHGLGLSCRSNSVCTLKKNVKKTYCSDSTTVYTHAKIALEILYRERYVMLHLKGAFRDPIMA